MARKNLKMRLQSPVKMRKPKYLVSRGITVANMTTFLEKRLKKTYHYKPMNLSSIRVKLTKNKIRLRLIEEKCKP